MLAIIMIMMTNNDNDLDDWRNDFLGNEKTVDKIRAVISDPVMMVILVLFVMMVMTVIMIVMIMKLIEIVFLLTKVPAKKVTIMVMMNV